MKKQKLNQKEKKDWNIHLWQTSNLVTSCLHGLDYGLNEMQNNPLVTFRNKENVSKSRKWVQKYLKQIGYRAIKEGMGEQLERENNECIDRFAMSAGVMHLMSQMPEDQLEYAFLKFEEFCQQGVLNNIQNQINEGLLVHHIWTLDGELVEFVHNYEGNINELLGNANSYYGHEASMDEFIAYCKQNKIICCRVKGLKPKE